MTSSVVAVTDLKDLRGLVDRAAQSLADARSSAEILDAREMAGIAYDVAKRAARLRRAKDAHDALISAAHRAQAHALEIESKAKHRLADEYDAAQLRGDIQRHGGDRSSKVSGENLAPTVSDLGLTRKEVHEARLLRDAEAAEPGLIRRTLDEAIAAGREPNRAVLRRAAENKLQRSIDRLKRTEHSVRQLESEKTPHLTQEQRAVFGTPEDRAIHERIMEIIERIEEQPAPPEAVRRVPPASRHAVDTAPIRRAAAWLTSFSTLYEQEVQNGTKAAH
jgi:hypothetical protein